MKPEMTDIGTNFMSAKRPRLCRGTYAIPHTMVEKPIEIAKAHSGLWCNISLELSRSFSAFRRPDYYGGLARTGLTSMCRQH